MSVPISIALLNDYEVIAQGVRRMLEPFADRVEVVDTSIGDTHLDVPVDIALYDTFGRPGIDFARVRDLTADPKVDKVAVYTSTLRHEATERLLDLGVAGCLSKSLSAADLVRALENIHRGKVTIAMTGNAGPAEFDRPGPNLSYRETEVLALLSQGLRNRAIANSLYVGEETVKSHLKSIYRKLGVGSRGEAIAWALSDPSFVRARPLEHSSQQSG